MTTKVTFVDYDLACLKRSSITFVSQDGNKCAVNLDNPHGNSLFHIVGDTLGYTFGSDNVGRFDPTAGQTVASFSGIPDACSFSINSDATANVGQNTVLLYDWRTPRGPSSKSVAPRVTCACPMGDGSTYVLYEDCNGHGRILIRSIYGGGSSTGSHDIALCHPDKITSISCCMSDQVSGMWVALAGPAEVVIVHVLDTRVQQFKCKLPLAVAGVDRPFDRPFNPIQVIKAVDDVTAIGAVILDRLNGVNYWWCPKTLDGPDELPAERIEPDVPDLLAYVTNPKELESACVVGLRRVQDVIHFCEP